MHADINLRLQLILLYEYFIKFVYSFVKIFNIFYCTSFSNLRYSVLNINCLFLLKLLTFGFIIARVLSQSLLKFSVKFLQTKFSKSLTFNQVKLFRKVIILCADITLYVIIIIMIIIIINVKRCRSPIHFSLHADTLTRRKHTLDFCPVLILSMITC
jgi:hypothetical protein